MRLKPDEIKKLATTLGTKILNDPDVTLKVPKASFLEVIEKAVTKHFEIERQIEIEADRLLAQQATSSAGFDRGKTLLMIKKQLAEQQKFVLSGGPEGRFSSDKILQLAHHIGDRLFDDDLCDFVDEDEGPKYIRRVLVAYFGEEGKIAEAVKRKIQSLANAPFEGSREWDVLYRKYFEEEMKRKAHT